MPELPDVTIYVEALRDRIVGQTLERVRLLSPFVLRSVAPPIAAFEAQAVRAVSRLGKRIVLEFPGDRFLVMHLMIAGRLLWRPVGAKTNRIVLATFAFGTGALFLTEASPKKRASLTAIDGREALEGLCAGGIEPLDATEEAFARTLTAENRTLKRALTNPRAFSGIGNAYSDEILHAARLSPLRLTHSLTGDEIERLRSATVTTLKEATERLRSQLAGKFPGPGEVTAFRPEFAAHGKFGQPCPACGAPIQRIRYAENETNYCARCQNEGRLLADRALSRLLKDDWPRTLEEMEGS